MEIQNFVRVDFYETPHGGVTLTREVSIPLSSQDLEQLLELSLDKGWSHVLLVVQHDGAKFCCWLYRLPTGAYLFGERESDPIPSSKPFLRYLLDTRWEYLSSGLETVLSRAQE